MQTLTGDWSIRYDVKKSIQASKAWVDEKRKLSGEGKLLFDDYTGFEASAYCSSHHGMTFSRRHYIETTNSPRERIFRAYGRRGDELKIQTGTRAYELASYPQINSQTGATKALCTATIGQKLRGSSMPEFPPVPLVLGSASPFDPENITVLEAVKQVKAHFGSSFPPSALVVESDTHPSGVPTLGNGEQVKWKPIPGWTRGSASAKWFTPLFAFTLFPSRPIYKFTYSGYASTPLGILPSTIRIEYFDFDKFGLGLEKPYAVEEFVNIKYSRDYDVAQEDLIDFLAEETITVEDQFVEKQSYVQRKSTDWSYGNPALELKASTSNEGIVFAGLSLTTLAITAPVVAKVRRQSKRTI